MAQEFCLIEQNTRQILIVLSDEPDSVAIVEQLKEGFRSRELLRKAGQFGINVYENAYLALLGAGVLDVLDDELAILRAASLYDGQIGLRTPDTGIGVWA